MRVHRICPKCGGRLDRIHRKPFDRLVSYVVEVHRYTCPDMNCNWEGIKRVRRARKGVAPMPWSVWFFVSLIGLACVIVVMILAL